MTAESLAEREDRLARLRAEAARLEAELDAERFGKAAGEWARRGYYLTYYATAGFFLGMVGALASLVFNIAGATIAGKDPLQLIRVYLTFGLGEKALDPAFDNGLALAMGCVLYIATGMLLGIIFQVVLSRYAARAGLAGRLAWATALAVAVWLVNFYGLISWLQPLLFGGNWIVDNRELPWWVALATHLVFGWTMAVIYPWGEFRPYRLQTENA
ncbi:MAG: hypothetical protein ACKOCX_00815 [Planctomycetota bacterium]